VRGKRLRRVFASITTILTISCWLFASLSSSPERIATLTLAVPSSEIPLPLQLVLAYGWQLQVAKEGIGHPWWTLGGFGVTFAAGEDRVDELKKLLLQIWRRTDWDPLIVKRARFLASQQILAWKRDPMEWLRWQARIIAMGEQLESLAPEQPNRVRLDDISEVLRKLSRCDLMLGHYDLATQSQTFTPVTVTPSIRHKFFRQTLKLPSSQRTHGLWWMLVKGDFAIAMVVGELLGGGTGSKWYQLLRSEKPIAYHAIAQIQWTPVGSELTLYAATSPENLKLAHQQAQKLLLNLRRGEIDSSEFERARKLAELQLRKMASDPIKSSQIKAIWLMAGHSLEEWENLPKRLQSLSLEEVRAFCRSLPPAAEILSLP